MRISYVSLVVQALFCCKRACDLVADRVLHCVLSFFTFSRVWAIVFSSSVFSVHTLLFFRCQFDSVLILIRIPSFLINIQYASVCLYKVFHIHPQTVSILLLCSQSTTHTWSSLPGCSERETERESTHPVPYIPSIHLSIQIQFRTYYVITYFQFSRKMKIKTAFALSLASSISCAQCRHHHRLCLYFSISFVSHFTCIYRECDVIWWDRYMNVVRILMIHNVRLSYLHPYFNMPLFI